MTENDALKIVRLGQLSTFKNNCDDLYQTQDVDVTGITANTVEGALAELLQASGVSDVTFQKLQSANSNSLASYRFTKGSGAGAITMDIDIPNDYVNNIVGIVAQDGAGHAGTFLKVNVATADNSVEYQDVDVSGLIEYITVGTQTGNPVQLNINSNHQITASIPNNAITKSYLATTVQNSLDLADSALQAADVSYATDADVIALFTSES